MFSYQLGVEGLIVLLYKQVTTLITGKLLYIIKKYFQI